MSDQTIQTRSGRVFDLLDPRPQDVDIDDIAWHLAALCRFTGATKEFYGVAQHSVLVSDLCWERCPDNRREAALAGLLHDAAEAYVGDVSSPLKRAMRAVNGVIEGAYDVIEHRVQQAILARYCVRVVPYGTLVKTADLDILAQEKRDLMGSSPAPWAIDSRVCPFPGILRPWPRDFARTTFVRRFHDLTGNAFRESFRREVRHGS